MAVAARRAKQFRDRPCRIREGTSRTLPQDHFPEQLQTSLINKDFAPGTFPAMSVKVRHDEGKTPTHLFLRKL